MPSLNKVILIGHVGSEPELRHTGNQQAVCHFSVATNETWKDKNGAKKEQTEWHRVTCWGTLAENTGKYLQKGGQVFVEGRIQTRSYEKNGQKKVSTEIVANRVLFLDKGKSHGNNAAVDQRTEPVGATEFEPTGTDDITF